MPRPARADSEQTRARLLAAAETAFAEHGLRGATLAQIASAAGIRRPSLLYHFPSKEVLYAATVERTFGALREALFKAMVGDADFETRLRATVRAFASFVESRPAVAALILREVVEAGPGRSLLLEQMAPLVRGVSEFVIREGGARLRPGLPVRAAVMQVAASLLLRGSAGELRDPLWGAGDHAEALAVLLMLEDSTHA